MPFIGKQPEVGAYSKLDAITTSATATYNLALGGGAYYPSSANHLLVSLNGVMQAPQDSFTVSGSTIVFASALTSSDNIDFIMALGDVLDIGTPSDGTVTAGKIASNAVTSAKIVNGAVTSSKLDTNITISGNLTTGNTSIVTGGRFISSQVSNDPWLKGVNSSNTETSYIKKDGQIYSAFGISLGGTGAANTLDDYEVGTWTPTITGYGGGNTQTYSAQVGKYTKIGNLVIANYRVRLSAKGNISGNYTFIAGLPFNHSGTDAGTGAMSYWWSLNGNHSVVQAELGGATPGVAWVTYLSGTANNGTSYMNTSLLTNTTGFQGTLIYQIL